MWSSKKKRGISARKGSTVLMGRGGVYRFEHLSHKSIHLAGSNAYAILEKLSARVESQCERNDNWSNDEHAQGIYWSP
jgi:hypothetical protein